MGYDIPQIFFSWNFVVIIPVRGDMGVALLWRELDTSDNNHKEAIKCKLLNLMAAVDSR